MSDDESLQYKKIPLTQQVSWQAPRILQNKGFVADTLIKTLHGYQQIQNLQIGDIVYKNETEQTTITDIFHNDVHQFIRLTKDNVTIDVGDEQQFLSAHRSWMYALCITPHDIFLDHDGLQYSFDSVEMIKEDIRTYSITVDHHIFTATQFDLVTHNSAIVIAPSIILNCVQLFQPVITLFGVTLSLYYFSSYAPPLQQGNTITYPASPEKIYFDTRYQQLQKLKQEFICLHAALKTIKCQFQDQVTLLSYQQLFNNKFIQTYNITAQYEATLDFEDRLQLTEIRQKILYDLEEEICNIQIAIGLFVNEILHRKSTTIEYYNSFIQHNQDPIHQCLKLPNNINYHTIIQYYTFTAICNMLLEEIDSRNKECNIASQCFNFKNEVINKTTNIIEAFNQEKQNIALFQATIEKTKLGNQIKIQNVIIYFKQNQKLACPNINQQINNVKNELHQSFQNKSKNKAQSYPQINPPPKKPDQDDDDREIPRIYVGAKYHAKKASAIKSAAPKNGQDALDFSLPIGPRIRVGISENEIVILARTLLRPQGGSEWHGYATTWDDLESNQESEILKTLKKNGLVKNNGKII